MGSFLDKLLLGIKQVWRNGTPMPQRSVINLIDFAAVLDNPALGTTDVFSVSTGGSGGGSVLIIENNGSAMPLEPSLNFIGFNVVDDPGNTRTNVSALPAPVTVTSNTTLTLGQTNVEFTANAETITLPGTPNTGTTVELTHIPGGAFGNTLTGGGQVQLNGNGHNVEDPQDRFGLSVTSPAASVSLATDFITYRFRYNGTLWRNVN